MASRMMHYVIAKRIAQELNIADENVFCLGSVVVDSYKARIDQPKSTSHFSVSYEDSRTFNFRRFKDKYLNNEIDAFSLGYFLHLLMDSIYLKDIISNTIYQCGQADRPETNRKLVSDMHIYNAVLQKRYGLVYDLPPLARWKVEEIRIEDQQSFLEEFKADFTDEYIGDFSLLTHDILENFMEKSFEIGLRNIQRVLDHRECDDPRQFALSNDSR